MFKCSFFLLHPMTITNEDSSSIIMMVSRELTAMRERESVLREPGDGVLLLSRRSVVAGRDVVDDGETNNVDCCIFEINDREVIMGEREE